MPAEYGQRSFPTRNAKKRRTRESVHYCTYITLCVRTKKSVRGPEDDYRCGQAVHVAAVPDSPARLKVTCIIFIITIRRRHTIIHIMYIVMRYNRERVPIRIDVGYIAVTHIVIYYFFPI